MRRQYFGRYKKGDRMKRYGFGIDVGGTAIKMGLVYHRRRTDRKMGDQD